MEDTSSKTSTWFALRNPVFRRLWLAMVISGSCIGAHNTAVYLALNKLGANTVLLSMMATVSALPYTLLVAALGGMGWTLSASELWAASQRAMPDWARGRMNATMVMVAQAATALGGVIWGFAAHHAGVVPTFLGAAA